MADVEILKAARARIADPLHWTTKHLARNETGRVVGVNDKRAVCWCAYGALGIEGSDLASPEANALRGAAVQLHGTTVARVNDEFGHTAVLAMYDAAIASAEGGL